MNTYKKHGLTKEDVAVHNRDSWLRKPGTSLEQADRRYKIASAIAEQRGRNKDYGADRTKRAAQRDSLYDGSNTMSKRGKKSVDHALRQYHAKVKLNDRYEKSLKEYSNSKDRSGGMKGLPTRGDWDTTLRKYRNN